MGLDKSFLPSRGWNYTRYTLWRLAREAALEARASDPRCRRGWRGPLLDGILLLVVLAAALLMAVSGCSGADEGSQIGTNVPTAEPETVGPEAASPTDELMVEAVRYVYEANPLSFADGNCFGYGAEADFGTLETVEVLERSAPQSGKMTLRSGPVFGDMSYARVGAAFSQGRQADYAVRVLRSEAGEWYVDVNNCGVFQLPPQG